MTSDHYRSGHGDFWLDLEVRGSATLKDLDHYLRAIWLECCGHLSQFSIGGWGGESEIAKKRRVAVNKEYLIVEREGYPVAGNRRTHGRNCLWVTK